jgi:di/tricarboxylate transporter
MLSTPTWQPNAGLLFTFRWLIAIAYWLAGGFIKSGLGNRIAYAIVAAFGKTSLGLVYSLVFAEALLSPAIPSVAARAGGIFFPLAKVSVLRDS